MRFQQVTEIEKPLHHNEEEALSETRGTSCMASILYIYNECMHCMDRYIHAHMQQQAER